MNKNTKTKLENAAKRTYLTIPTSPISIIALGMSKADFELLKATVNVWEKRICPAVETYTPDGFESIAHERDSEQSSKNAK